MSMVTAALPLLRRQSNSARDLVLGEWRRLTSAACGGPGRRPESPAPHAVPPAEVSVALSALSPTPPSTAAASRRRRVAADSSLPRVAVVPTLRTPRQNCPVELLPFPEHALHRVPFQAKVRRRSTHGGCDIAMVERKPSAPEICPVCLNPKKSRRNPKKRGGGSDDSIVPHMCPVRVRPTYKTARVTGSRRSRDARTCPLASSATHRPRTPSSWLASFDELGLRGRGATSGAPHQRDFATRSGRPRAGDRRDEAASQRVSRGGDPVPDHSRMVRCLY